MEYDLLGLLLRLMHIIAAITAVGGTIFMRFALVPSVAVLSDEQRKTLHEEVRSRWSKLVMFSILFLLVSGLVNFYLIITAARGWPQGLPKLYHPVFGVKFLLAFAVFFIASALSGRGAATQQMRDNAKFWMTANVVLALSVVVLSSVLRMTHTGPNLPLNRPAGQSSTTP